ncbi:MAG: transposase, partial [Methanothrix sp.]
YLAVDSDGEVHSSEQISQTRERLDSLKARLQSKGTKSAKRHLKKLSGRTARFSKDVNHCISKKLVAKALGFSQFNPASSPYDIRDHARQMVQGLSFFQNRR